MNRRQANIGLGDLTVTDILRYGAQWHTDRRVEVVGRPAATLSYGQLPGRAAALAEVLADLGIAPGRVVGSLLWNTAEHLIAYFAVPAMGALLHTVNPRLSPAQLRHTIHHAADEVLIVDADLLPLFAEIAADCPTVRAVLVVGESADAGVLEGWRGEIIGWAERVGERASEYVWPTLDERSPATLCFTTGTTGDPKGVAYSHRSIWIHALSLCTANAVAVSAQDRGYIIVPMFHANAWGYPYATFWAGGDLLLAERDLDPATVVDAIAHHRPTFSNGVPTVWNAILQQADAAGGAPFASLERVILGGAPIPATLREGLARHGVSALQGWGMTETSPLVTLNRPPRPEDATDPDHRAGYQGRVLPGVQVRLADLETEATLPCDGETVGELHLRGPWIADSYYGIDAPEKFSEGWLRTGDVGTVDPQGYVHLTDRAKDVIKSGGEWISSVQLELEIATHPSVVESAVFGVPDEKWDERPCAVVVLREGPEASLDGVREHLRERVPRWWLPERWAVVDEIPRTSVGKFDKVVLRGHYADGTLRAERLDS